MSQLPRLGLSGSIGAPGLTPTPPVSQAVTQADQIGQALGLTGQVVGQIGQIAQKKTQELEAAQAGAANAVQNPKAEATTVINP